MEVGILNDNYVLKDDRKMKLMMSFIICCDDL